MVYVSLTFKTRQRSDRILESIVALRLILLLKLEHFSLAFPLMLSLFVFMFSFFPSIFAIQNNGLLGARGVLLPAGEEGGEGA